MQSQPSRIRSQSILAIGVVLFAIGQSVLLVIIAPLSQSIGLTAIQFGLLLSLANTPLLFAAPFWGKQSDVRGRKPIFIVGLFGSSIGTLLVALVMQGAIDGWYPLAWVAGLFALSRGFYSATASAIYPSSSGYIADVTNRAGRAQGMAVIGGANSLGGILGPAIGGGLAFLGLLVPMYVIAIITLIGAFGAIAFLKEPSKHVDTKRPANLKFTDPRLRPFMFMWACFFLVFISLNVVTAFYIRDRFEIDSPERVAQITSIALITMAIVITIVQGGVFQIIRPSPAVLVRLFGPAFLTALLLIAFAPNLIVLTIGYGFIGLAFAFATPGINGGVSLIVEPHEQGAAAGILAAATTVGPIFGPTVALTLFTISPVVPILAGAAIFTVVSLFALTVKVPEP